MKAEAERLVREEGLSYYETGKRLGICRSTIGKWLDPAVRQRANERKRKKDRVKSEGGGRVPVSRLREAVHRCERLGTTRGEICTRIGWSYSDTSRLARRLGELGEGGRPPTDSVMESLAVRILNAIHLDPVDVGI